MLRILSLLLLSSVASAAPVGWRGPHQSGAFDVADVALPSLDALAWSVDLAGRGSPVVHDGRVHVFGYRGEGPDLVEVLAVFDLQTGAKIWERTFRDFLSDIIYDRYSIGAPGVDSATGAVYVQSSAGLLMAFSASGEPMWEVSMMERLGRLTFPNGRTGAPVVDEDRVIVHGITANWGRQGPARDRFYAFDTHTGDLLWSSTPGLGPKDSSFSTPVVAERDGRRVLYAGTGCGHAVAVDARTGEALWRFRMSVGGVNVSPVLMGDVLVVAHDMENLDSTRTGRIVGLDVSAATVEPDEGTTPVLDGEVWRLDAAGFSSSPVADDELAYQVTPTGELLAIEGASGAVVWRVSLGPDQLHASPALADGRLYVPLRDGSFHVVQAGRDGGQVLATMQLPGSALGAPAVAPGRILVHTTERLLAFDTGGTSSAPWPAEVEPVAGAAVTARVRPAEVLLTPGEQQSLVIEGLDAHGLVASRAPATGAAKWIPPTAKVRAEMDASFVDGALVAAPDAGLSAGAWKVDAGGLEGTTRGRTVVGVPTSADFEGVELVEQDADGSAYAYPPLAWIGARFKWQVRQVDGSAVLAKTLDRMLFQRATTFIGHPDQSGYTLSASVMSRGDRRQMSAVGVVNQRYYVVLKGNQRVLEISSNQERLKQSVPFRMQPDVWYRLVSEVRVDDQGAAHIRAKAWPRDEPEPDAWTVHVVHPGGHTHGAPGLFGLTPNNLHRVYLDDIVLEPTEDPS